MTKFFREDVSTHNKFKHTKDDSDDATSEVVTTAAAVMTFATTSFETSTAIKEVRSVSVHNPDIDTDINSLNEIVTAQSLPIVEMKNETEKENVHDNVFETEEPIIESKSRTHEVS